MRALLIFPMVLAILSVTAWIVNVTKLVDCDFVAPYKCEVIHAIGIVPPMALGTVWFGTDEVQP